MTGRLIFFITRNNLHLTKKAVASALVQSPVCDVCVLDNCSTDGTIDWLRTQPIAAMHCEERLSLAACWNRALKAAWETGYKHAMLCNNDIEMRPDAYELLLEQGGEFVSCVSVDSREQMHAGDADKTVRLASPRPHPDFSCFLIHKSVTDRAGWFDESYFPAYAEDADYHVRMHRAGVHAVCVDVPFLHHGASTLKSGDPAERSLIERGAQRNRERFRETYGCYPGSPAYEQLFR